MSTASTLFKSGLTVKLTSYQKQFLRNWAKDVHTLSLEIGCMWAICNDHEDSIYSKNYEEGKYDPKVILCSWYDLGFSPNQIKTIFQYIISITMAGNSGSRISALLHGSENNKSIYGGDKGDMPKIVTKVLHEEFLNIIDPATNKSFLQSNHGYFGMIRKYFSISSGVGKGFLQQLHSNVSSWVECYKSSMEKKKEIRDRLTKICSCNEELRENLTNLLDFVKLHNIISLNKIGWKFVSCFANVDTIAPEYLIKCKDKNDKTILTSYSVGDGNKTMAIADYVIKNSGVKTALSLLLRYADDNEDVNLADIIGDYFNYQGYAKLSPTPDFISAKLYCSMSDSTFINADMSLNADKSIEFIIKPTKEEEPWKFTLYTSKSKKRDRVFTGDKNKYRKSVYKKSIDISSIESVKNSGYVINYQSNGKDRPLFAIQTPNLHVKFNFITGEIHNKPRICFSGETCSDHGYDFFNEESASLHPGKEIRILKNIPKTIDKLREEISGLGKVKESYTKLKKVDLIVPTTNISTVEDRYTNHVIESTIPKFLAYSLESIMIGKCQVELSEVNSCLEKVGGVNIMSLDLGLNPTFAAGIYHLDKINNKVEYDLNKMLLKRIDSNEERNLQVHKFLDHIRNSVDYLDNISKFIRSAIKQTKNTSKYLTIEIIKNIEQDIANFRISNPIDVMDIREFKNWCMKHNNNTVYGEVCSSILNHFRKIKSLKSKPDMMLSSFEKEYWEKIKNKFEVSISDIRNMNFDASYKFLFIVKNIISLHVACHGADKSENSYHTRMRNYFNNLKINSIKLEAHSISQSCLVNGVKIALLGKSSSTIRDGDNEFADVLGIPTRNKAVCDALIRKGITVVGVDEFLSSKYDPVNKIQGWRNTDIKKEVSFNVNGKLVIKNSEEIACDNIMLSYISQRTYVKTIKIEKITDKLGILDFDKINTSGKSFIIKSLLSEYNSLGKSKFWSCIIFRNINGIWIPSIKTNEEEQIIKNYLKFKENDDTSTCTIMVKLMRHGHGFTAKVIKTKEDIDIKSSTQMLAKNVSF